MPGMRGRPATLPDLMAGTALPVQKVLLCEGACAPYVAVFDAAENDADTTGVAKGVCAVCPVRAVCLAYAVDHEEFGIWGGHTPAERDALRGGPFDCALEQRQKAARLRDLFKSGAPETAIAEEFGVSTRTVQRKRAEFLADAA